MIAALVARLAGARWALAFLRWGALALAVLLFLLSLRRAGERADRLTEHLEAAEKANDAQRRMLEAAVRRPRDRDEPARHLRDGRF